jgi:hypothetical protein
MNRLAVIRAGLGAAELLWPRELVTLLSRPSQGTHRSAELACRVLGLRDLAQATALGLYPRRRLLYAGAVVDAVHAASMVLLARERHQDARRCTSSAVVAAALCAATLRQARVR